MNPLDALKLITETVQAFLNDRTEAAAECKKFTELADSGLLQRANSVLESSSLSYRDGLLIQLAFRIVSSVTGQPLDVTRRHEGARTVAKKLGEFLASSHISGVKDAYQNIGKNTKVLTRGNFPEFDSLLHWASGGHELDSEVLSLFRYGCARIASTARSVAPMPKLDSSQLSFARVTLLFHELMQQPSGGAYEQFSIAALIEALVAQSGITGLRVETKNINASDKSSRAAGDIQVLSGNRVIEAYEVSANSWHDKISGAAKTIRDHDLARLTILACANTESTKSIATHLRDSPVDISVLDIGAVVASLTAMLTRPFRATALNRLYELLDRYQPDSQRVNSYVTCLQTHSLIEK